ncbi:hypothetical protein DVS28_a4013 [Euzebya pacifica]|uniref:Uncharacterized protein n=1 Tax=Euzebya pacifica TaxID=1608957 RepID=A0A346Y2I5_9ACTN|nr:hypothetical protein DVS28_a4013 [Euzebya pacifica]
MAADINDKDIVTRHLKSPDLVFNLGSRRILAELLQLLGETTAINEPPIKDRHLLRQSLDRRNGQSLPAVQDGHKA